MKNRNENNMNSLTHIEDEGPDENRKSSSIWYMFRVKM